MSLPCCPEPSGSWPWTAQMEAQGCHYQPAGAGNGHLVLAVVRTGYVPLLWTCSGRRPCPAGDPVLQRAPELPGALARFGTACARFITADREFVRWIAWLQEQRIPFRIGSKRASICLRCKRWRNRRPGGGSPAYTGDPSDADWGLRGEPRGTCSGRPDPSSATKPVATCDYRLRSLPGGVGKIETLFQALKGNGFDWNRATCPRSAFAVGSASGAGFVCWCLRSVGLG